MRNLETRPAQPDEAQLIIDWGLEAIHGPALKSKQTAVLCVHNGKPVSFACVQAVGLVSGIASDPKAWSGARALALKKIFSDMGMLFDEVFFFTGSEADAPLEKIAKRHGFECLPWKVWRKKNE